MATFIIGTLVIGSMVFVAIKQFKKYKNGESTCGCSCSGCFNSKKCHKIQK